MRNTKKKLLLKINGVIFTHFLTKSVRAGADYSYSQCIEFSSTDLEYSQTLDVSKEAGS